MQSQDTFSSKTVLRASGETITREKARLIVEEPLEIRVNGLPYTVLMRTPGNEIELTTGFCLTEQIVDSPGSILSMGYCGDDNGRGRNTINVLLSRQTSGPAARASGDNLMEAQPVRTFASRTSCGICGTATIEALEKDLTPLSSGASVSLGAITELQYKMSAQQHLSRLTTGAHAVALAKCTGDLVVVREDVGRHNALDKVIGYAMIHEIDCNNCFVLLSGRISLEMVQKAIRAHIPVVVAVSAATGLAVELADRFGCTLVGRLRDKSMVIYTHPERIMVSSRGGE